MKTIIRFRAIALHTEHCYVQHPTISIEDEDHVLWDRLTGYLKKHSFHRNHFCVEGVDENGHPVFVGYNDGKLSIGSMIGSMADSKSIFLDNEYILLFIK